ncbi:TetR/AcrR family transcriptional regulator [Actinomadura opuntiae]|uniref:TetR/AcrR family transcriptional regulator n=1 Tax=Actinomadura sp. OS1-43 TaxID=604315 RepID=UPI00255B070A|nr:TetR/AcrR family transcriptional regulator [Actinomadura sp. OS1-43]MDL4821692.1 helix-turn-helix domain-containing protein [Actinomadura sp. OS1-43]
MTSATRRRADAERNIEAILDAALARLGRDPSASMTEIAKAAGVGRVTLYGHFPSREALVDTLFDRSLADADAVLGAVDVDAGRADEALARLVRSSWRVLDRQRTVLAVALRVLGPERVRDRHAAVFARLERLLRRGREEGVFSAAEPPGWQATAVYSLMHAAALEVDEGRLDAARAAETLVPTILGALRGGAAGAAG